MEPYAIFKIEDDLYKAYDYDHEDWQVITPTGERFFSKHKHLTLEQSFQTVFDRIADEYKIERYKLMSVFIK